MSVTFLNWTILGYGQVHARNNHKKFMLDWIKNLRGKKEQLLVKMTKYEHQNTQSIRKLQPGGDNKT